jgi:hypothetical protein
MLGILSQLDKSSTSPIAPEVHEKTPGVLPEPTPARLPPNSRPVWG